MTKKDRNEKEISVVNEVFIIAVICSLSIFNITLRNIELVIICLLCAFSLIVIAFFVKEFISFILKEYDELQNYIFFDDLSKFNSLRERYQAIFCNKFFDCFNFCFLVFSFMFIFLIFLSDIIANESMVCTSTIMALLIKIPNYKNESWCEKFNSSIKGMVILGAFFMCLSSFGFLEEKFSVFEMSFSLAPIITIIYYIYKPDSLIVGIDSIVAAIIFTFISMEIIVNYKEIIPTLKREIPLIKEEFSNSYK